MTIGFALLTTSLIINGTIKIGQNTSFLDDVVFSKVETLTGSASISNDGKSMTFTTEELIDITDEFTLNFEITNKNKGLDAHVTIECGATTNAEVYNKYITSTIEPNEFIVKATETESGVLKVKLNKLNYNESVEIKYGCTMNASAIEKEENSLIPETEDNMISYITNLAKTDTVNLAYDDTEDKNLRYIGEDPNNYILFNDELWRVIGIMNNVYDSNGNKTSRIKIIRNESIGNYSYDNKPGGNGSSVSQFGSNDWTDSAIMSVLNTGPYWNRSSGECPYEETNNVSNSTIQCDFTTTGLKEEAKIMISNTIWNLGGTPIMPDNTWTSSAYFKTTPIVYKDEKGSTTWSSNNITRPNIWTGYVGLMYASDYGYATGGESRNSCLSKKLGDYLEDDFSQGNCKENDWLFDSNNHQRTISPSTSRSNAVLVINLNGNISANDAYSIRSIRPVVYLNTNVKIIAGEGTSTEPYVLE